MASFRPPIHLSAHVFFSPVSMGQSRCSSSEWCCHVLQWFCVCSRPTDPSVVYPTEFRKCLQGSTMQGPSIHKKVDGPVAHPSAPPLAREARRTGISALTHGCQSCDRSPDVERSLYLYVPCPRRPGAEAGGNCCRCVCRLCRCMAGVQHVFLRNQNTNYNAHPAGVLRVLPPHRRCLMHTPASWDKF